MKKISSQRGFTFVELAISMVIIGLLIVSILAGSAIIRAAKIRSIINDINNYQSAFNLFVTKYGEMPGDAPDITNSLSGANLANGNGDNEITWSSGEGAQAWYQMMLAGMVQGGGYTGQVDGSQTAAIEGSSNAKAPNIPGSNISNAGYAIDYDGSAAGTSNHLHFAVQNATGINNTVALSPTDALNIDTKLDDGIPNSGRVQDPTLASPCSTGLNTNAYNIAVGSTLACMLNIQLDSGS